MIKMILVLALGIAIGHYGPIGFAKISLNAGTKVLHSTGNVVADVTKALPSK